MSVERIFYIMGKSPGMDEWMYIAKDGKCFEFDNEISATNYIKNVLVNEIDVFPQGTFFKIDEIYWGEEEELKALNIEGEFHHNIEQ
jgi:hypothetical protein